MRILSVMGIALGLLLNMSAAVYADQRGLDYPHNSAKGYTCDSCHYVQGSLLPTWISEGLNENDLDDTLYNKSCWECHNDIRAPFMPTHSNQSEQAVTKYGAKWSLECRVCHWPHHQKQTKTYTTASYLKSGAVTLVGTNYIKTGTVLVEDALIGNILIPNTAKISYQYRITDNTTDTITVSPNLDSGIVSVGNTFAVIYGMLIKSTIKTPNSGDKAVRFFRPEGANSFADGVDAYDGVCEVCHTKTTHYRNNGTGSDQSHENIDGKNGTNCVDCHKHENGFRHAGSGTGSGCGDAVSCHGLQNSHPAHVAAGGNLAAACSTCHDTDHFPNFKHDNVCDDCHHDGTYVATGVKVAVTPPVWKGGGTIGCDGCHKYGPSYKTDSPKANSHPAHKKYACNKCHSNVTTTDSSITTLSNHINDDYNLLASGSEGGVTVSFTYAFNAAGSTCSNISCHGSTNATWGGGACLGCHSISQGNRVAIAGQFSSASHHVQGITVTNSHCYQCHWEANYDGTINATYHSGSAVSGAAINLVVYGAGSRPQTYSGNITAISYSADGSRSEIAKLNAHCLSCHSDQNNDIEPFGDCNTPRQYAWDRNSVKARYSQAGVTTWGKYKTVNYPNVAEKNQSKAYSAHGNAVSNQGGWNAATGLDATIPNTRPGYENVLCFDCHNSHGSMAAGTTSSYVSFNGSQNGAILKNTTANQGGYAISYTPAASTDSSNKNPYNAGADLCFDCHFSSLAIDTPWGYQQTFGATAAIQGYKDGARFGSSYSGTKQRFNYRAGRLNLGGHMMASASLKGLNGVHNGNEAKHQINGLCTPCHDPHGVSPTLGNNQKYGVPLLKGTWLTSPYQEDSPEMTGRAATTSEACQSGCSVFEKGHDRHWNTDRVTFDTNNNINDDGGQITEDASVFAGLCLNCHTKANLTDGTNKNTTWKSVDRIHETVKGWGSNNEHTFSCSKCHVPHNAGLPRLMQTNCLNFNHRQQVVSGGLASNRIGDANHGQGFFPGVANRSMSPSKTFVNGCHESAAANGGGGPPGSNIFPGNGTWPNYEL